jgi:hypothetical protein
MEDETQPQDEYEAPAVEERTEIAKPLIGGSSTVIN